MNVLERFKKAKNDFENRQTVRQAGKLEGLRKERIKQEGKAKIRSYTEKEKGRIEKAKSTSFFGKLKTKAKAQTTKKKPQGFHGVANRISSNNKKDAPYWMKEKPKKPYWLK